MSAKEEEQSETVGDSSKTFCPILDEEVGLKEFFRSTKKVESEEIWEEM
jgi:hypothetical protein